jgi:hypothetical protein
MFDDFITCNNKWSLFIVVTGDSISGCALWSCVYFGRQWRLALPTTMYIRLKGVTGVTSEVGGLQISASAQASGLEKRGWKSAEAKKRKAWLRAVQSVRCRYAYQG